MVTRRQSVIKWSMPFLILGTMMMASMGCQREIMRHRRPAKCLTGLPCYDGYRQKATVARIPGLTFTGFPLIEREAPEEILARLNTQELKTQEWIEKEEWASLDAEARNSTKIIDRNGELDDAREQGIDNLTKSYQESNTRTKTVPINDKKEKPPVRIRYFALADNELRLEHCALTRVSMILWSDGRWELFVRAEQNTEQMGTLAAITTNTPQKQTSHIKRNEFHIVMKGFGASEAADTTHGSQVSLPVMLHRTMEPFWVERGQPQEKTFKGKLDDDVDFNLISRFEVEFAYR